MKKSLFYSSALVYCLLGSAVLAENDISVKQNEPVLTQTTESVKETKDFSDNLTEATNNPLTTITAPLQMDTVSEGLPSVVSTTDNTNDSTIVETIEPITVEIMPEPALAFAPTSSKQNILIPEYIIYEAIRPDLTITHPNPHTEQAPWFLVGVRTQSMKHFDSWGRLIKEYPVSTAKKGIGEVEHSYQTPRGHHKICEKIGDGLAPRTIISRRQPTEWFYTEELHKQYPKKDWILTRILWLCGQEEGKNKGYNNYGQVVDSYRRYIYIHGAGDHAPFGIAPSSLGCVRMNSEDVIDVFSRAPIGTDVVIDETK